MLIKFIKGRRTLPSVCTNSTSPYKSILTYKAHPQILPPPALPSPYRHSTLILDLIKLNLWLTSDLWFSLTWSSLQDLSMQLFGSTPPDMPSSASSTAWRWSASHRNTGRARTKIPPKIIHHPVHPRLVYIQHSSIVLPQGFS